ncbi:MAG: long-chain fatty acid--CoA ligase [Actinomycetales bacterium]|nr:long-chain fatty acid--CoA ligase [Actinomycetales bacterium]
MLTQHHEPLLSARPDWRTLVDAVTANAHSHPDAVVAEQWDGKAFVNPVTARVLLEHIRATARGLAAAGVRPGDRVAIMSRTRYEWTVLDFAIWHAGAVTVPIYETSSAEQVRWILTDSKALCVVVEDARLRAVVEQVRADLPALGNIWTIEEGALAEIRALASADSPDIDAALHTRGLDDPATLIYTSGTTGRPKGCVLTHRNMVYETHAVLEAEPTVVNEHTRSVLFLPLAHVFARVLQAVLIATRARIGYCSDVAALTDAMKAQRPTLIVAVPRVFEKLINTAAHRAAEAGKSAIFDRAVAAACDYSRARDAGRIGLALRLRHALFDRLVYGKLRATLGGDLQWAVSGGAPLGERLGHAFRGMGITVLEGYGLTETTAGTTVNRPQHPAGPGLRIGTVGRPVPGTAVRIADDGEVQLLGPHIFREYWNNPAATADTFTPDGWFRTGDLGSLDDDGFLRITGRAKELIVTAGGKNVAPAVLEDPINASFLVAMSMVVGDARPFVAALVTLDHEALRLWLRSHNLPETTPVAELVNNPDLRSEIQRAVDTANLQVSKAEQIKKFAVLPHEWTIAGGQITPSMKLKRSVVTEQHASDIDALYTGGND